MASTLTVYITLLNSNGEEVRDRDVPQSYTLDVDGVRTFISPLAAETYQKLSTHYKFNSGRLVTQTLPDQSINSENIEYNVPGPDIDGNSSSTLYECYTLIEPESTGTLNIECECDDESCPNISDIGYYSLTVDGVLINNHITNRFETTCAIGSNYTIEVFPNSGYACKKPVIQGVMNESGYIVEIIQFTKLFKEFYIKTKDGWKQSIPYVKTENGWKQGEPSVKKPTGWAPIV